MRWTASTIASRDAPGPKIARSWLRSRRIAQQAHKARGDFGRALTAVAVPDRHVVDRAEEEQPEQAPVDAVGQGQGGDHLGDAGLVLIPQLDQTGGRARGGVGQHPDDDPGVGRFI